MQEFSHWDWVQAHLDDKHDPDGQFRTYEPTSDEDEEERYGGLVYEATMALPLVSIGGADDLRTLVVEPLMQQVGKRDGGP